jgi:hypothetical protein
MEVLLNCMACFWDGGDNEETEMIVLIISRNLEPDASRESVTINRRPVCAEMLADPGITTHTETPSLHRKMSEDRSFFC